MFARYLLRQQLVLGMMLIKSDNYGSELALFVIQTSALLETFVYLDNRITEGRTGRQAERN